MHREDYDDELCFVTEVLSSDLSDESKLALVVREFCTLYQSKKDIIKSYHSALKPDDTYIEVTLRTSDIKEFALAQAIKAGHK